jgi:hypothetical protein
MFRTTFIALTGNKGKIVTTKSSDINAHIKKLRWCDKTAVNKDIVYEISNSIFVHKLLL